MMRTAIAAIAGALALALAAGPDLARAEPGRDAPPPPPPPKVEPRAERVEDVLSGQLLISDRALPTTAPSPAEHVRKLKAQARGALRFDPATGVATIHYAGFFARPADAVSLELVIYDVSDGRRERVGAHEVAITRGKRSAYGALVVRATDYPPRRTYRLQLELRRAVLAAGTVSLRDGRGPPPPAPDAGPSRRAVQTAGR